MLSSSLVRVKVGEKSYRFLWLLSTSLGEGLGGVLLLIAPAGDGGTSLRGDSLAEISS